MSHVNHIRFAIAYEGSSQFFGRDAHVETIDLVGTKSEISAHSVVPGYSRLGDSSLKAGRLKWCLNDDHLDQIALTPKVASAILFTARVFATYSNRRRMIKGFDDVTRPEQRTWRYDIPITIEDRPKFETGKCYLIKVQAVRERSFKATFTKVAERAKTSKDVDDGKEEVQRGMRKMDETLITKELKNLQLASRGEASASNSSTPADLFARAWRWVIPSAQQMVPGIRVAASGPSESTTDLDQLTPEALQSRFEEVFKKDQEFERQHLQALRTGNIREYKKILKEEQVNSGLFIRLAVALERKGFQPKIPNLQNNK